MRKQTDAGWASGVGNQVNVTGLAPWLNLTMSPSVVFLSISVFDGRVKQGKRSKFRACKMFSEVRSRPHTWM